MNILLIEDEQRIADFIVTGFTDVVFTTHWEQDGFRGLTTALIRNFDVVFPQFSRQILLSKSE